MITTIHNWIVSIAILTLIAIMAVVVACLFARAGILALRRVRISRMGGVMAAIIVFGLTYYAGSKAVSSFVQFPITNPDIFFLADDGTSLVSEDNVRIGYKRHQILPDSADFNVWRRKIGETNTIDWVAQYVSTVGESPSPVLIPFNNATNYEWIVFTTWQPSPTVQTNGVLHCSWRGVPGPYSVRLFGVPMRTYVISDGVQLAPPQPPKGDDQ